MTTRQEAASLSSGSILVSISIAYSLVALLPGSLTG